MKIVYIAAGAADMICGSGLHDNTLAAALIAEGEDVLLVPTYTPLRTDEDDVSIDRVFFNGINVYLEQKSALFRKTPWWLDRMAAPNWLLNTAGKRATSTDPALLGELTVSMLEGENGRQKKELDELLYWLKRDARPDVIHLSNSLLLGMAGRLRNELNALIACTLSGEDIFIEKLRPPHYDCARKLLIERSRDVDAFVALNRY